MTTTSILSVTTAAATVDLVALATWKDDFRVKGNADDAFITRAIVRCSRAAANYCNRTFGVETLAETIYLQRDPYPYQVPGGVRGLQLSRWPLISVTSVTQVDAGVSTVLTAFPGADPTVSPDFRPVNNLGELIRLDSFGEQMDWPAVRYDVVYQAGYILPGQSAADFPGAEPLPDDIIDAVGRMVYSRYAERERDPLVAEESVVGVGSVKYIVPTGSEGNLSPDVADLLDNYRVPVTA